MPRHRELDGCLYTFYSNSSTRLDEWILEQTNVVKNGFFIEIPAGNGIYNSNTRTLEEIGWTGILVEPDETLFHQLQQNRPNCPSLRATILPAGIRRGDGAQLLELATLLQDTPTVDFLVLNNGTEVTTLERLFDILPKKLIRFLAVGYNIDQNKLKRLQDCLKTFSYQFDQLRGHDACFKKI